MYQEHFSFEYYQRKIATYVLIINEEILLREGVKGITISSRSDKKSAVNPVFKIKSGKTTLFSYRIIEKKNDFYSKVSFIKNIKSKNQEKLQCKLDIHLLEKTSIYDKILELRQRLRKDFNKQYRKFKKVLKD